MVLHDPPDLAAAQLLAPLSRLAFAEEPFGLFRFLLEPALRFLLLQILE